MADNAYFSGNPIKLDISRSRMNVKPRWTGNWNTGELVPIFATQVLPGSTYKMSVSSAIRMITPVVPVMDDMDITVEAFFVPNRLILSRKSFSPDVDDAAHSWEAFIGAQDSLLNMPTPGDIQLPACMITASDPYGYVYGGLADALGFPPATYYFVNCLKPLAYYSIWNEYWREPNTMAAVTFSLAGNAGRNVVCFAGSSYAGITASGSYYVNQHKLAHTCRYHGYFGSALPWPQRNATEVVMPLGNTAPVKTSASNVIGSGADLPPLRLWARGSNGKTAAFSNGEEPVGLGVSTGEDHVGEVIGVQPNESYVEGVVPGEQGTVPANLFTDLSQATAATVNQFRLAVQTQRWYEALARSGNKYPDLLAGMFDVRAASIPSRPEYLGGFTAPIQMSQVTSTADVAPSGSANTGLGRVGAYSLSNPGGFLFTKSFTEHGVLMVVATCRTKESFSQGIAREDTRFERFQFFWPQFANLGNQEILEKEIFVNGSSSNDDSVFGYQEAWAEERMIPDKVTGDFRASRSMGHWTYVNNFTAPPSLSGYLDATGQQANVNRTLAVSSSTAGFQFFGQFEFDITMVKPMPLYSIPGLVDHH